MECALTTELRNFSGRGSLISNGGSSGVRLSSSGKNLERTRDLSRKKRSLDVDHRAVGALTWLENRECVVTLTRGWLGHCSACSDDTTRPWGGHRIQRRAPGHVPLPTEPAHTQTHKMSKGSTNKHSSTVKETTDSHLHWWHQGKNHKPALPPIYCAIDYRLKTGGLWLLKNTNDNTSHLWMYNMPAPWESLHDIGVARTLLYQLSRTIIATVVTV